jgi:hypothetical protein
VSGVIAALALAAGLAGIVGPDPLDLDLRGSDSSQAANSGRQHAVVRRASGELHSLVYHFVDVLSRREAYQRPRPGQAARLANAFRAVQAGRLHRADALARPLGYKVVRYRDVDTRRRLVLLVERRLPGRGWGLYVHSPGSRSRLIVEVAHPASDIKSERVGLETFESTNAADLFVAGALRHAASDDADVAHNENTPFAAVHLAALKPTSLVFQPHGFDSGRRDAQYGEIVLSSGGPPTDLHRSLAHALEARGLKICLYQQGRCAGLGATTNVEGDSTRVAGALFVHLELALRLRKNGDRRARIVRTISPILSARAK